MFGKKRKTKTKKKNPAKKSVVKGSKKPKARSKNNYQRLPIKKTVAKPKQEPTPMYRSKVPGKDVLLRLRGKDGTFKMMITTKHSLKELCEDLSKKIDVDPKCIRISRDQLNQNIVSNVTILEQLHVKNGHLLFYFYQKGVVSKQEREEENKRKERAEIGDGNDVKNLGLKYVKKHWTLNEYLSHVDKKKTTIKMQKYGSCARVLMDASSAKNFHNFLHILAYSVMRCGYLYGSTRHGEKPKDEDEEEEGESDEESDSDDEENEKKKKKKKDNAYIDDSDRDFKEVVVDALYEPCQEGNTNGFIETRDPTLKKVDAIAKCLYRERVGYIFSYSDDRKVPLLAEEIIRIAKMQAEFGPHFVTVVVQVRDGNTNFEAFQVSEQCVEMVKKGLLSAHKEDNTKLVSKNAVEYERKFVKEFDCLLFVVNVRIGNHKGFFNFGFPPKNRSHLVREEAQTKSKAKQMLQVRKKMKFHQQINDFHFLIWLSDILDIKSDFPSMCKGIITESNGPILGFKSIIEAYLNQ